MIISMYLPCCDSFFCFFVSFIFFYIKAWCTITWTRVVYIDDHQKIDLAYYWLWFGINFCFFITLSRSYRYTGCQISKYISIRVPYSKQQSRPLHICHLFWGKLVDSDLVHISFKMGQKWKYHLRFSHL